MATLKGVQRAKRGPSYSGKFMIDTVRGVLRVRKWPRKRGTPKSALQLWWIDWFRQANLLAKYVDAASARRAIEITANSGMYPRDVLLAAMRGRLYIWQDQAGKVWHPMAAIQDISDSLDVLAQDVGSLLVRYGDRWRALSGGSPGDVVTRQADGTPPSWQPAAGGGGFEGGALVMKSANQAITTATWTPLSFDQESYDTAGVHDIVTNNSRLVVPAGRTWIRLGAGVSWASSGVGVRSISYRKNNVWTFAGRSQIRQKADAQTEMALPGVVLPVVPTDYFEFMVNQNTGGNLNALTHNATYFSMELL